MYVEPKLVRKHFEQTAKLLRAIPPEDVANWLLTKGYFPEPNIVPPSFSVGSSSLKAEPYNKDVSSLTRRQLSTLSYPKSLLTSRQFAIMHPWNYHDVVFYLYQIWTKILNILFHQKQRIYPYSLPIPVSARGGGTLSNLRAGRMIYEWLQMAENDLVSDAVSYRFFAKTDIANFYASIYTHSVAWAIEGRDEAFNDKGFALYGNKIDRLLQYANDGRTNGISVGSALSDLIAEVVLSDVDRRVSENLEGLDFVAVRFKDDYRILTRREEDAKEVLREISNQLAEINLSLNENKTHIAHLPDGLYRGHDREYFPHSLKTKKEISFKTFEHTLLIALDIHRRYPGTSILEKFLSELFDKRNNLKLVFPNKKNQELNQVKKLFSLLFLVKQESEKTLSHVLAIIQAVVLNKKHFKEPLKAFLHTVVKSEIEIASSKGSAFEIVWYVFFSRYLGLGITAFAELINNNEIQKNAFVSSMVNSQNKLYPDTNADLFKKPKDCKHQALVDYLDVF